MKSPKKLLTFANLDGMDYAIIIITQARLRRAAGEPDVVNLVRFLYICSTNLLGSSQLANHLVVIEINQGLCCVKTAVTLLIFWMNFTNYVHCGFTIQQVKLQHISA